ncbi:MAG TPA: S-adenosylmethionine decarboxylase [Bryobacteraceae bacterium]|jgi:S-adenosylmethionine decarboxylase
MSGCEWIVEAHGCDAGTLKDLSALSGLFGRIVQGMHLNPVQQPTWHQFPGSGGITGLSLLAESHIACHTFPEYGSICLNVFCCRPRPEWDFEAELRSSMNAGSVRVRRVDRPYSNVS